MCIFFSHRYLEKLKRYISNRARPEGLIAEASILKERINNWSLYIDGIETVHNRRERNEDFGKSNEGLIFFFWCKTMCFYLKWCVKIKI